MKTKLMLWCVAAMVVFAAGMMVDTLLGAAPTHHTGPAVLFQIRTLELEYDSAGRATKFVIAADFHARKTSLADFGDFEFVPVGAIEIDFVKDGKKELLVVPQPGAPQVLGVGHSYTGVATALTAIIEHEWRDKNPGLYVPSRGLRETPAPISP